MDPGSDPSRDDYGLPPVDIEIPDDARDLDRDVQAYYRERRALRRRSRAKRVFAPLVHRGLVIPLVAVCVALTLLAGTLFTVRNGRLTPLASGGTPSGAAQRSAAATPSDLLPDAQVLVGDRQIGLRSLALPAVLTWVPLGCRCGSVLSRLTKQADQAHVAIYFVGTDGAVAQLPTLAGQAGKGTAQVVDDTSNILGEKYKLSSLSAILAHRDGSVRQGDVVTRLTPGVQLETQFQSLGGAGHTQAAGPATQGARPQPS